MLFAFSIQIAALLFAQQNSPTSILGSETASDFAELANISQMDIVPILYNKYTIFAFHKISSYLLGVTVCTVVLALAVTLNSKTLAFSNQFTLGSPWGGVVLRPAAETKPGLFARTKRPSSTSLLT
jgi:hypothetical protein